MGQITTCNKYQSYESNIFGDYWSFFYIVKAYYFQSSSPKYLNKVNNSKNSDVSPKQTSHNVKKRCMCDCQNQNCIKCIKAQERNINNNLTNVNNNVMGSSNTLTVSRASSRGKLRQQSSSQGSFESSSNSPCLSRGKLIHQVSDIPWEEWPIPYLQIDQN